MPLFYAVLSQRLDIVKMLIEKGVNINSRNKRNETALFCACMFDGISPEKSEEIAEYL